MQIEPESLQGAGDEAAEQQRGPDLGEETEYPLLESDTEMKKEEASPPSPTESASPAEAAEPIEIEIEPLPDVAAQLAAELLTETTQRLLQDSAVLFVVQPRPLD